MAFDMQQDVLLYMDMDSDQGSPPETGKVKW